MKAVITSSLGIVIGLMMLPVVLAGGDAPSPAACEPEPTVSTLPPSTSTTPATTSTDPPVTGTPTTALPGTCVGGSIEPITEDWALPGPRELLTPSAIRQPHHDYPAWDWMIPENTPIYAIHTGTVVAVRNWPHNWWSKGCGANGGSGCDTCGVGVTIVDSDGVRWTYCHGNHLTIAKGDAVKAGQQILWSGNTGRSGAPHLHVEIRVNGQRRCPQPLVLSIASGEVMSPGDLPLNGCFF